MITQFVNQIEQHPESLLTQAEIMARMKRDTSDGITGWFHTIRVCWRKVFAGQPATGRSSRIQCEGVERGCQATL